MLDHTRPRYSSSCPLNTVTHLILLWLSLVYCVRLWLCDGLQPAVVFACGNSLVCETMEDARRVAFGSGERRKVSVGFIALSRAHILYIILWCWRHSWDLFEDLRSSFLPNVVRVNCSVLVYRWAITLNFGHAYYHMIVHGTSLWGWMDGGGEDEKRGVSLGGGEWGILFYSSL